MDDDDLVKIEAEFATVGDYVASALYVAEKAATPAERAEAERILAGAAEALRRADGDMRVMLRDVADSGSRMAH